MQKKDEQISFYYLRIIATIAVMMAHIAGWNWHNVNPNGHEWLTFNFYQSLARFTIPVFVMMSGALFLPREIDMKKIFSKNIVRMLTAFIFWTLVYTFFWDAIFFVLGKEREFSIRTAIPQLIEGHYHMWYVLMMVGLYLCLPIMKHIVSNEKVMDYLLIIAFIFLFAVPQLLQMLMDFGTEPIGAVANSLKIAIDNISLDYGVGYSFFFILGYKLNTVDISKKQCRIIYALGLTGFALSVLLNQLAAYVTGEACGTYYGTFTVNMLAWGVAVFVWFKKHVNPIEGKTHKIIENERVLAIAKKIAAYSFGAYLVHPLLLEILAGNTIGLHSLTFNPILSIPVITLLVFAISIMISGVINHIPILKKYIV